VFGARRDDFEADLGRILRQGRFSDRQPSTKVFVWQKGPAAPQPR
jgi:hypothetical protein